MLLGVGFTVCVVVIRVVFRVVCLCVVDGVVVCLLIVDYGLRVCYGCVCVVVVVFCVLVMRVVVVYVVFALLLFVVVFDVLVAFDVLSC